MSPGLQRAAIEVERENPLTQRETDQVEPLLVDFKSGVDLFDTPLSLDAEMLLQTERRSQRRRRKLKSQSSRWNWWGNAAEQMHRDRSEHRTAPAYPC